MSTGVLLNSALAMNAQSHAMGQISANIANINTVGYKRAETNFSTLLSFGSTSSTSGSFSAGAWDRRLVSGAGALTPTGRTYDVALSGDGFFVVSDAGSNQTYYTRAGSFSTILPPSGRAEDGAYLGTGQGMYVMGSTWNPAAQTWSGIGHLRLDDKATLAGQPTTRLSVVGNVEAGAELPQSLGVTVYSPDFQSHGVRLHFEPSDVAGVWNTRVSAEGGTASGMPAQVRFNAEGRLVEPAGEISLNFAWDSGGASAVRLDPSTITQLAGATAVVGFDQDGCSTAPLVSAHWEGNGVLWGTYGNGRAVPLVKLAVAQAASPDLMEAVSDTLFAYQREAGALELLDLETDPRGALVTGEALEASNVDVAQEFSRMIITQRAYSGAATVFRTGDEMLQTLTQL
ncbi:flagellar basal body protein [Alphaproteobacteria bacterium]|nr:flagellar basal body protein [Alphaproteobacteria bacterium]